MAKHDELRKGSSTRRQVSGNYDKRDRRIVVGLVAVLLFGAFLRIYRLHVTPPGLFFDEAANLFDITGILHGDRPIYFPRNNGREPFFFYWASLFASVWGVDAYAIRLASACIGVLTIAATFLCAREMLRAWGMSRLRAEWSALAASFILGITYLDLHYSRIGLRAISLPLFLAVTYGLLFRGLRRGSWTSLAFAGLWGGLSIYTYIPSRIAPVLLILPVLVLGIQRRSWRPLLQMVFVGVLWVIVAVPLGVYALRHPGQILGHTGDVSILSAANNHGDPLGALIHGIVATFGAFDFVGTSAAEQNLPGRPILDPIMSVLLLLGLVYLVAGMRASSRDAEDPPRGKPMPLLVVLFLLAWIGSQSISSALAVNPPGFIRMTGTLPAVAIVIGCGVSFFFVWLGHRTVGPAVPIGVTALLFAGSTVWTVHDYFGVWAPSPEAYHLMMGDKTDSAADLNQWARDQRVFLAPLYAQDNTIKFLTQGASIQSFDLGLSLVVPTDRSRDVRYVFPASETDAIATVEQGLRSSPLDLRPRVSTFRDPSGRFNLLTVLDLRRNELPVPPKMRIATFQDEIALVGATALPERVSPGQVVTVTLEWLTLRTPPVDETVFLHLQNAKNQTVAQMDRQPTGGSFPTSQWHAGDLVFDRYGLSLPRTLPSGRYVLVTGMYELKTLKRMVAQTPTGRANSDEVTIAPVDVNAP